jgi:hypothetical protein
LRVPHYLDNRLKDGGKIVSFTRRPHFTPQENYLINFWYSFLLEVESTPRGLLYNLSKLKFSTSLLKLLSSFLSQRKFSASVEGKISTPREMQAGLPQDSVLSLTLYVYINDAPQTSGVYLALFADDTSLSRVSG